MPAWRRALCGRSDSVDRANGHQRAHLTQLELAHRSAQFSVNSDSTCRTSRSHARMLCDDVEATLAAAHLPLASTLHHFIGFPSSFHLLSHAPVGVDDFDCMYARMVTQHRNGRTRGTAHARYGTRSKWQGSLSLSLYRLPRASSFAWFWTLVLAL